MKKKNIKSEINRSNRSVSDATRYKLWAISAGRCQLCNKIVYTDSTFGKDGNLGQLAHIHAVGKRGPRHWEEMETEELNNTSNLMLMCQEHHKMIDDNPELFPAEYLRKMKQEHESRIVKVTGIDSLKTCKMVSYCTRIEDNEIISNENDFKRALISENLVPGQDRFIDLASYLHNDDRTKEMYEIKAKELSIAFRSKIEDITESKESIAVFALAPMPLLIKLGTLINDQYNAKIFQRHRVGEKWSWKNNKKEMEYLVENIDGVNQPDDVVAINISLSTDINNTRIKAVIGENVPIVTLKLKNPDRNFVTSEHIADLFVHKYREMIEEIKHISNPKKILLFPAMPSALAVRLGQDFMKKTDPMMSIYDQDGDSFIETIIIGGESDER